MADRADVKQELTSNKLDSGFVSFQGNVVCVEDDLCIDPVNSSCLEKNILKDDMVSTSLLETRLRNLKADMMKDVQSLIIQENGQINYFKKLCDKLQSENDHLKQQLKELNGFLDVLVDCLNKRINACSSVTNVSHDVTHSNVSRKTPEIDDNFQIPKRSARISNNLKVESIPLSNSFTPLTTDEIDDSFTTLNVNDSQCNFEVNDHMNATESKRNNKLNDKFVTTRRKKPTRRNTRNTKLENNNKRYVSILGDSIIKEVKGYELSTPDTKVFVKSFSGATTSCMEHHIKPSLSYKPDMIILHCGTNNLKKNQDPSVIADRILHLATESQRESPETAVVISAVLPRNDRWHQKSLDVNVELKKLCNSMNIGFLEHEDFDKNHHLNRSRIHPNRKGTEILQKSFKLFIEN